MMERVGKESPLEIMRGRIVEHVFIERSDPTSYSKQNIEIDYAISSCRLIIDEPKLRHTKIVQRKKLSSNWEKMIGQQL
ncbi:hypothetical protein TNCV_3567601 [Trichonephila clavipes]|nr:hypothetical protein TNCV_3567601 [Trichonephila clavipes]